MVWRLSHIPVVEEQTHNSQIVLDKKSTSHGLSRLSFGSLLNLFHYIYLHQFNHSRTRPVHFGCMGTTQSDEVRMKTNTSSLTLVIIASLCNHFSDFSIVLTFLAMVRLGSLRERCAEMSRTKDIPDSVRTTHSSLGD